MPLPVSSSGLPPDVAVQGWAAITVQVAWTLLSLGVSPRRTLSVARDHVLLHLEPGIELTKAEDLAAFLTRGFVARVRNEPLDHRWMQDVDFSPSARWRTAIIEAADPVSAHVFRLHYGAGVDLDRIASVMPESIDRLKLEGTRAGLRAMVRQTALNDELPLHGWTDERLDKLLGRLAAFSPYDSPSLVEVAEGCHADWVSRCPRCERTVRLVRARALTSEDLEVPVGAARPRGRARILAIHVHPDARRDRARLRRELNRRTQAVDDDILIVDDGADGEALDVVRLAAQVGAPHRDHLRVVRLEGAGRWSSFGLLGPLVERAVVKLRSQPWGTIDGTEELPEPLPPPPSAVWAWSAVGALGAVVAMAVVLTLAVPMRADEVGLDARFVSARGGVWSSFTANDRALLLIVGQVDGQMRVFHASSSPAHKAALTAGDGVYRHHFPAQRLLVAASDAPFEGLSALISAASDAEDPLLDLSVRLRAQRPGSALALSE